MLSGKKNGFTSIGEAEATFDFKAREKIELSFKTGDLIKILWQHDSGWWKGELNGRCGLLPANYCRMITKDEMSDDDTSDESDSDM